MTISSFTIHNFRTFEHLCLEKLQRVNLIAGDNNTGKTALLEALWQFMAPDQPDIGCASTASVARSVQSRWIALGTWSTSSIH